MAGSSTDVPARGEAREGALLWSPAAFFVGAGAALACTLCPHACRLDDGAVGRCGVRRRRGDRLETATRAVAVRHLDPVEKKPLYHFRPGTLALTLGTPGCSFTCHYCLNHRLSQVGPEQGASPGDRLTRIGAQPHAADRPAPVAGSGDPLLRLGAAQPPAWRTAPVDPEAVVAEAASRGAAVALSYSEPSLAAELTLDLAAAAGRRGVPLLWKTNGFLTEEALAALAPVLAAVNLDLKASDEARHRALTGAPLAPVLAALSGLVAAGVWVEVSTPVIPGFNDDDRALAATARAIAEVSPDIPWHLVRFVPELRMRRFRPTPPETLARAAARGREAGLRHVYVERALGEEGRATRCAGCQAVAVRRGIWATEEVALEGGACARCGEPIPGRW